MKKTLVKLFFAAFAVALLATSVQANDLNYVMKNISDTPAVTSSPGIYILPVTWRVNAGTLADSWEGGTTIYDPNLTVYVKSGKVLDPGSCSFVMVRYGTTYNCVVRYAGGNEYSVEIPILEGYTGTATLTL